MAYVINPVKINPPVAEVRFVVTGMDYKPTIFLLVPRTNISDVICPSVKLIVGSVVNRPDPI